MNQTLKSPPVPPSHFLQKALEKTNNAQMRVWLLEKLGRVEEAQQARTELRELLSNGKMKIEDEAKAPEIRGGAEWHDRRLVVFENGERGIWKPGVRSDADEHVDWKAEVGTYELAELYGLPVPMTVKRTIDGKEGSLQILIPAMSSALEMSTRDKTRKDLHGNPALLYYPRRNGLLRALDYLAVVDNRNLENYLLPTTGTPVEKAMRPENFQIAIDNGSAFFRTGRYEIEQQTKDLDAHPEEHDPGVDVVEKIRAVPDELIVERLKPYQTESYVRNVVLPRRRHFLEVMDKLHAKPTALAP